jgi:uncharacterized membrane protein
MNILESATKIVLLMIALTVCIGFLMEKLPVEFFIPIVTAVFGFYFAYKGDETKQFAGK